MSKTSDPGAALAAAVRQASEMMPMFSDEQRRLKARFWRMLRANPLGGGDDVTPDLVEQVTGANVRPWIKSNASFWPWFRNQSLALEVDLDVAAEKAMALAVMYLDPSVPMNDNARVSLIKYILEFKGLTPPNRKEIKWADRDVERMTPEQLQEHIKKLQGV